MPRVRPPRSDAGQLHLLGTARDIMRSYGITFETLDGEIPEPGDLPAEPPAPALS